MGKLTVEESVALADGVAVAVDVAVAVAVAVAVSCIGFGATLRTLKK